MTDQHTSKVDFTRVLRPAQVADLTGLPVPSIPEKHIQQSRAYDPSFPKPIQLSELGALGWIQGEVIDWIDTRPRVGADSAPTNSEVAS